MIRSVNYVRYHFFHDSIFRDLIARQDGWLIFTDKSSMDDYQNAYPFSEAESKRIKRRLGYLCDYLTDKQIRFYFVIPPNKNTIYSEYLPSEIEKLNSQSLMDQILARWKNTDNCTIIDLRERLLTTKIRDQVYYSTDTHWNNLGAFLAYQEIIKTVQIDYPNVPLYSLSDYSRKYDLYRGDLTSKSFGQLDVTDDSEFLIPKFEKGFFKIELNIQNDSDIQPPFTTKLIDSSQKLPSAIVFRDSFFSSLISNFSESFNEVVYFWSETPNIQFVDRASPDIVILEITERLLKIQLLNLPGAKYYRQLENE